MQVLPVLAGQPEHSAVPFEVGAQRGQDASGGGAFVACRLELGDHVQHRLEVPGRGDLPLDLGVIGHVADRSDEEEPVVVRAPDRAEGELDLDLRAVAAEGGDPEGWAADQPRLSCLEVPLDSGEVATSVPLRHELGDRAPHQLVSGNPEHLAGSVVGEEDPHLPAGDHDGVSQLVHERDEVKLGGDVVLGHSHHSCTWTAASRTGRTRSLSRRETFHGGMAERTNATVLKTVG